MQTHERLDESYLQLFQLSGADFGSLEKEKRRECVIQIDVIFPRLLPALRPTVFLSLTTGLMYSPAAWDGGVPVLGVAQEEMHWLSPAMAM